jgi:acid ceramidase
VKARNLDFGIWPALYLKDGNFWELTHVLRPIVVNVEMQQGGKTLYKSTTFAGFIGAHGARFSTEIYTRGCHWIPRMFA